MTGNPAFESDTPISGTSLSAPFVTGIVALLMEEFPELKSHPEKVITLLEQSCQRVQGQTTTFDKDAGFGLVNYSRARQLYADCKAGISTLKQAGSVLGQSPSIALGYGDKLSAKSVALYPAPKFDHDITINEIVCPKTSLSLVDEEGRARAVGTVISNTGYLDFENDTVFSDRPAKSFRLVLTLAEAWVQQDSLAYSLCYEKTDGDFPAMHSTGGLVISNHRVTQFNPTADFDGTVCLPDDVTAIGSSAFQGKEALKHFVCSPSSHLSSIGSYAFMGCANLATFFLPSSVAKIGYGPFWLCTNVEIYTPLGQAKTGWDETWNLVSVDYEKEYDDIANGNFKGEAYYQTFAPVHWKD